MTIPTVPTDNLYKFAAILGAVIIVGLGVILPGAVATSTRTKVNDLQRKLARDTAELAATEQYVRTLQEIVQSAKGERKKEAAISLVYSDAEIKGLFEKAVLGNAMDRARYAESEILREEIEMLYKELKRTVAGGYLAWAVGWVIMAWGFTGWRKQQILLDEQLKLAVESARKTAGS